MGGYEPRLDLIAKGGEYPQELIGIIEAAVYGQGDLSELFKAAYYLGRPDPEPAEDKQRVIRVPASAPPSAGFLTKSGEAVVVIQDATAEKLVDHVPALMVELVKYLAAKESEEGVGGFDGE